jgi:hypothetical protein
LDLLETALRRELEARTVELVDFAGAIRDSQIPSEFLVMDQAFVASAGTAAPQDHLTTAKTVTDSAKGLIEGLVARRWAPGKSILRMINELISIVRGVA